MTDIAVAHDQFRTMGGAERVAVEIARAFDCPIYAMRVDADVPPEDVDVRCLSDETGQWLMRRHFLIQDAYQMLAWQHVDALYEYDTIIQTKNNPAWFIPHSDSQTVIRYTHSTPRGMYDQFHRRGGSPVGDVLKTIQRVLYQQTTPYADHWICNSEVVQRRVESYADPASAGIETIHPPVETDKTSPEKSPTQDYYLYIGRLAVNKRIDLLCDVAAQTDKPIVVAGDGAYKAALVENPPANLTYLGRISEQEKWRRLSEAAGFLMLAESEDFGITPIESMAAGTPVIGANEGFTQYQVKDGKNGYLAHPTVPSVLAAIDELEATGVTWDERQIADYADQFSVRRFHEEIQDAVAHVQSETTITPAINEPIAPLQTDD
jgi:glycosyltransferase involved in cell wall biosynthesis